MFLGAPKFLRAQLMRDYSFVKRGLPAPAGERNVQMEIAGLRRDFPHLKEVRLLQLRHFLDQVGVDRVRKLAASNLSGFEFRRAMNKELQLPVSVGSR